MLCCSPHNPAWPDHVCLQVGMLELLEGVRRQRFGVDGGGSGASSDVGILPDLRKKLGTWLLEAASGRPVKVATA